MAVRNFNDGEKQKLVQIISQGSQVLGEVDDLKTGLKDTVKANAEEYSWIAKENCFSDRNKSPSAV